MLRDKIPPLPVDQNPYWRESTAGFDFFNLGKASVQIDVKSAAGKECLWTLLEEADIFISNTRPASLEKLGFGWEAVRQRCPTLVYAHVSGWGRHGPDSGRAGFDVGPFFSATGMSAAIHGGYQRRNISTAYSYPYGFGDCVTGHSLLAGIMLALSDRAVTGKGRLVSTNLFDTGLFCAAPLVLAGGGQGLEQGAEGDEEGDSISDYDRREWGDGAWWRGPLAVGQGQYVICDIIFGAWCAAVVLLL